MRQNKIADELAKLNSRRTTVPPRAFLQELQALAKASKAAKSSQETPPLTERISESPKGMQIHSDWHTPFMIYLRTRGLLEDKDGCEQLHHQAGHYTLLNDELFQQSLNGTLMRCITPDEWFAIL
jgi:hypothetical protein